MKRFIINLILIYLTGITSATLAQDKINSYTLLNNAPKQYEKAEWDISVTASFSNPYDHVNIALEMMITTPSNKTLMLPCYYVSGSSGGSSNWKARLAPQEAGAYKYFFKINKAGIQVAASLEGQFNSAATGKNGFLHKNNNWTFIFDSGKAFRGIGENFCWEPRDHEAGGYKGQYMYDYLLPKLANNGANFFRTWMCQWNLPLEWKDTDSRLYNDSQEYFNPSAIKRMEQLVGMAESLGLYMMLVLDYHGAVDDNWWRNNYNVNNGGPAAIPREFFSNASAKAKYKNRLRYIVARWGYSTSIGAWEFWNEIDNGQRPTSIPHADITNWHSEMATYLKAIDPYKHLVTTSISHEEISGLFNVSNIDFNQQHIYASTGSMSSTIKSKSATYGKPFVIGEFGYRWEDDNESYGSQFDYDFKRGLWYGLFTPTPILPLSWWWEMFDKRGMTSYLKGVREIHNNMLAAGDGSFTQLSASSGGLESYAVRCGQKHFIYLLNGTGATINTNVGIGTSENINYTVQNFAPSTATYTTKGSYLATNSSLSIPNVSLAAGKEMVLVITPANTSVEQTPYSGIPYAIPGKVEAENYDLGGEGVAYHDSDATNEKGQYRTDGVDIEIATEGNYNIAATQTGEWLEYTVNIQTAAIYTLQARVAAIATGKTFHIELDGVNISGNITVPNTGGWQSWQTVSVTTPFLTTGKKVMRVVMDAPEFNLNHVAFEILSAPVNLALNKSTTASSTEGSAFPGSLAVDGSATTRWASLEGIDPQWIYVDLGAAYNINRVKITWEAAYAKDYQIQVSTNASAWTNAKTITGNTTLVNDHTSITGIARYVRIYGTARGTAWGYSIYELEVYGTTGSNSKSSEKDNVSNLTNSGSLEDQFTLEAELYPNPADMSLNIKSPEALKGGTIKVFSGMGKQVYTGTIENIAIDLSQLKPGIYTAVLQKDDKKIIRRFVKK